MKEFFQVRRVPPSEAIKKHLGNGGGTYYKGDTWCILSTQAAGGRSKPVTPDIYLKQFRQSQTSSHFFSRLKNPVYSHFLKSLITNTDKGPGVPVRTVCAFFSLETVQWWGCTPSIPGLRRQR